MSSSNLSRNKMSIPVNLATSKNNRLRSELRRVMSDRVLKITRCSQQQNAAIQKHRLDSSITGCSTTPIVAAGPLSHNFKNDANLEVERIKNYKSPLLSIPSTANTSSNTTSSNSIDIMQTIELSQEPSTDSKNSSVSAIKNSHKISLQPFKTFDLKDRESLIEYIKSAYNDVIDSNGNMIMSVQSIINSIVHFCRTNSLDTKVFLVEILKENLLKSKIDLRQKYENDEQCEKFKLEGQIQILLQIENYIISNNSPISNKVKVDEDWVWEIANSTRWLKQIFKDFKIEKFLFGEIYANYFQTASEFILSLMEELGYDKDDHANESSSNSPLKNSLTKLNDSNNEQKNLTWTEKETLLTSNSSKILSQLTHSNSNPALSYLREDSNSNYSFTGGVNSLFEDEFPERSNNNNNDSDQIEHDDLSQNVNLTNDSDKSLDDLKKKKNSTRFSDFSQSSVRSIVVQRKQMRLKIRSPYKSPSKNMHIKRQISINNEISRRSPRIKEKKLFSVESSTSQKRQRTYLVTDTPDHKQNATIITTRQEKLRKRFSFQQFNSPNTNLPIVPDTPVKSDSRIVSADKEESTLKMYTSPKKSVLFRL